MPQVDLGQVVGPQGPQGPAGPEGAVGAVGPQGPTGPKGTDATINGFNAIEIVEGENVHLDWEGNKVTINVTGGGVTLVTIPYQNGTLTYNKAEQTPVLADFVATEVTLSGQTSGTDAGTYIMTATLRKDNAIWSDATKEPKAITWSIGRAVTTMPTLVNDVLTYTGEPQSPSLNGYYPDEVTLGGDLSATDEGNYSTTVTPQANWMWSDGTRDTKSLSWVIGMAQVTPPTLTGTYTYNGAVQSPELTGYDPEIMELSGDTSAINAGTYSLAVSLKNTTNYKWSDNTTASKTYSWIIRRGTVEIPTVISNLTYTGQEQSPTIIGYDPDKMVQSGSISETDAGTYSVSHTPTSNWQWPDTTTVAKSAAWSIQQAAGSSSIDVTSLNLTTASPAGIINVTRAGTGTVSATSSNEQVADVSVSGNVVTVTGKGTGSATITIKVAADKNYTSSPNKTCEVTASVVSNHIFGVCWDYNNSSPALQRLTPTNDPNHLVTDAIATEPVPAVGTGAGSSPFDAFYPWNKIDEWNVVNGVITVKRGQSGFSRTANDVVVFIPEYYFRVIDDSTNKKRYFYVSQKASTGFTKHPGSGRCVGKYNTGAGYASKSGLAPLVSITRSTARTGHKDRGVKFNNYDFATWCAIQLLYLVEFANWDSQSKIGRGYVDGNSTAINTGGCDAMNYHTGRAAGNDGKTAVMYRWMENLWGNVFDWCDGANFNMRAAYICTNPANFADDITTNYTAAGVTLPSSNFISGYGFSAAFPWALIPNTAAGSETTWICDRVYSGAGWRVLGVGGGWDDAGDVGLFDFNVSNVSSFSNAYVGARQLYLPTEAEINQMAA